MKRHCGQRAASALNNAVGAELFVDACCTDQRRRVASRGFLPDASVHWHFTFRDCPISSPPGRVSLYHMPESDIEDLIRETQFVPQEDDEEVLWEVVEIIAEKGRKYQVRWAGVDEKTGQPWDPSWVMKHDCTDDLVRAWKKKKLEGRTRKKAKPRKSTKPRDSGQPIAGGLTLIRY